jgi:hypothetical protein
MAVSESVSLFPIQFNSIQYNTIQYDSIQCNAIQDKTRQDSSFAVPFTFHISNFTLLTGRCMQVTLDSFLNRDRADQAMSVTSDSAPTRRE